MNGLPLLGPYQPNTCISWRDRKPITWTDFLSHVASFRSRLPEQPYVVNVCVDRYLFLVGFAAALMHGQTTLLPPSLTPDVLTALRESYPNSYSMTDGSETVNGLTGIEVEVHDQSSTSPIKNPVIPEEHIAAIAFTSGSTGTPRPNLKTWGSLVTIAQQTGRRILSTNEKQQVTVVATVPHQHMYGLETSIMLPIQHGWAFDSGRPFYPEDIRLSLSAVPPTRILVSTPIHLRACVTEKTELPKIEAILSATAPLPVPLAQETEETYHTKIIEIYGFAEAGTIATRQTVVEKQWTLLDGLTLSAGPQGALLEASYHSQPIEIPDIITIHSPNEFLLEGRPQGLINIGGHRASLDALTHQLMTIDGVIDAAFYFPKNSDNRTNRPMAFVVAPGKSEKDILAALQMKVAPVFIPRPLYLVDSLPRNATGKLTEAALQALLQRLAESQHDTRELTITKGSSTHQSIETIITIGENHPSLPGHFPGNPVIPGVVILGEVLDAIHNAEGTPIHQLNSKSIKFHSPLRPNQPLTIVLTPREDEGRTFSCRTGSTLIASGELSYRLDDLPSEANR